LNKDSRLAIALICSGKLTVMMIIFFVGSGDLYTVLVIVSLSYLSLTPSARAPKNAVALSNGP
jgi:hypothetical protein